MLQSFTSVEYRFKRKEILFTTADIMSKNWARALLCPRRTLPFKYSNISNRADRNSLLSSKYIDMLGFYKFWYFTPRSHRAAIMPIKPRSEKVLDRGRSGPIVVEIEQFGNFWSSLRLYYDVPTSNALLTRFYYDVTLTDADQRPRILRLYYAGYDIQARTTTLRRPSRLYDDIATTVPIISRL
jgi:hypothetical protein